MASSDSVTPLRPRRTRRAVIGVALPVAAAASIFFWLRAQDPPRDSQGRAGTAAERARQSAPPPPKVQQLAMIEPGVGARFERIGTAPDEVVRAHHGVFVFEVTKLGRNERFRVITDDAEIEVRGTKFRVDVAEGHLTSVTVIEGRVQVSPADAAPVDLAAGERWHAAAEKPAPAAKSTRTPPKGETSSSARRQSTNAPATPEEPAPARVRRNSCVDGPRCARVRRAPQHATSKPRAPKPPVQPWVRTRASGLALPGNASEATQRRGPRSCGSCVGTPTRRVAARRRPCSAGCTTTPGMRPRPTASRRFGKARATGCAGCAVSRRASRSTSRP
jgi:hypothetical protein